MSHVTDHLTDAEIEEARRRRLVAMHLQEIEGNPLDAEQVAMFEMFEREGWSDDRVLAHLLGRAAATRGAQAAE